MYLGSAEAIITLNVGVLCFLGFFFGNVEPKVVVKRLSRARQALSIASSKRIFLFPIQYMTTVVNVLFSSVLSS